MKTLQLIIGNDNEKISEGKELLRIPKFRNKADHSLGTTSPAYLKKPRLLKVCCHVSYGKDSFVDLYLCADQSRNA